MITAVIFYMTYEYMIMYSYNAAYSQLQNVNDNSCINPGYLIMFLNKKFVYLPYMVRVAVLTCVYTLAVYRYKTSDHRRL